MSASVLNHNDRFLRSVFRRFLVPTVLSVLGGTVNTLVDSAIVGNMLGSDALAVVNLCAPIFLLCATLGNLIGTGGGLLSAALVGQEREADIHKSYTLAIVLEIISSVVLAAVGLLFLDQVVAFLGADETLKSMARDYALFAFIGAPAKCLLYIPFNYLRLDGKPHAVTLSLVSMTVCNGILDFVFIHIGWGMAGAALASVMGTVLGVVIGFVALHGGSFHLSGVKGTGSLLKEMLNLGTPSALNNLLDMARLILINRILMATVGGRAVAIFTVVCSLSDFTLCILNGVPQTGSPLIGVYRGEKNNPAQRDLIHLELKYGGVLSGIITLLIILLAGPLCTLFGLHAAGEGVLALRLFALSIPFAMLCNILTYFYNAAGRVMLANVITVCRVFLFSVIPAALLAPRGSSVWWFRVLAEVLTLLFLIPILKWMSLRMEFHSPILLLDERLDREGKVIDFSVENDMQAVVNAAERITDFCESNGLDAKKTMMVSLSIEEMLGILLQHCFKSGEAVSADVRVFIMQGVTGLRIRNSGRQFNPVRFYEEHKLEEEFEDTIGIKMILNLAAEVRYQRTFGTNTLTVLFDKANVKI